jgi:DNA-binding CsgD family transcriptional regulator
MHAVGNFTDFDDVLSQFQSLVGASCAQVIRHMRRPSKTRLIARHEQSTGKLFERPVMSFCSAIFGEISYRAREGTLWQLSETHLDRDTLEHLNSHSLEDVCVFVLNAEEEYSDLLELHLSRPLAQHDKVLLELLGPVLATGWRNRPSGSVEAAIAGRPFPVSQRGRSTNGPILGPENPAGLTRSEFRICTLIQSGRMTNEISETLNVRKSTLRSHMRAIYLKTGASGQVELVHLLHGCEGQRQVSSAR